jgi:1-acyl-sn-glycerol-3-phosphate acyltransferase
MVAWLRFAVTAAIFVLVIVLLVPLQFFFLKTRCRLRATLPIVFHRIVRRLLGFRVHVHGKMTKERPLLLAANHSSWTDIVVLGSLQEVAFIAKAQVANWPLFGILAKLQRTVFVEREKRGKTHHQASEIATRLAMGDAMVLFAEGTTSDGNRVLPFKTSLFGAAQVAIRDAGATSVVVQPVAIAYTRVQGMPMGRFHRPIVAWPGDVPLGPSLVGLLKHGAIDVDVWFGEPVVIDANSNRKMLARTMEDRVRAMVRTSLMKRDFSLHDAKSESAILKDPKNL